MQVSAEGKRQQVVEIANFVAAFTSIWLHREVRGDFDAEVLLEVVSQFLCEHGLSQMLTFDNDPREVAEPCGTGFPLRARALPALSWRATECSSPRIDPIGIAKPNAIFVWSKCSKRSRAVSV